MLGYLPGYLQEERYGEGTRYLLVGLLGLRGVPATVVVVARRWPPCSPRCCAPTCRCRRPGCGCSPGVLLLTTPVQPWYALLLLALVVLTGDLWALPLAAAPYPLFFATILDGPAVAGGTAVVRRRRRRGVLVAPAAAPRARPLSRAAAGRSG